MLKQIINQAILYCIQMKSYLQFMSEKPKLRLFDLTMIVIGLVIGAGASSVLARGASGLLFGVTAGDPRT